MGRRISISATLLAVVLVLPLGAAGDDRPGLVERTRATLATLVAFDTTNPPGNEAELAAWARDSLAADGIDARLVGPPDADGRANLIARVPGRSKSKKPLVVVAHVDVVGTEGQAWTTDPLTLTEQDGFVYGRGVIDNKGMVAASIEILRAMALSGKKPKRDVVLLLAADEESGGTVGTGWLLANEPDLLEAEYVLNEGGDVRIVGDGVAYVGLQTTEKLSYTFTLTADGQDGHSSMPLPNNAIARLGAAVADVSVLRWPLRTLPTTRAFAEGVAGSLEAPMDTTIAAVAEVAPGDPVPKVHEPTLEADPFWNASLRTTCVPTMIDGGTRSNALPARATAKVNCRLLPDEDVNAAAALLSETVEPHGVTVTFNNSGKVSPVSPEDGPVFKAARAAAGDVWPDAVVAPFMGTGGTDCRRFRTAGAACYGLLPFPLTADDERRMHGTDERLGVDDLAEGTLFLQQLILELSR
ncbi:MAG: M20/M25/M40 family metallo-hydrolase [Proteobacteria bacterium]|nr:M20/M25/M40 family metallo-hydrolase [Pseudomonadota bacterium]